jgi:hypothetical protein
VAFGLSKGNDLSNWAKCQEAIQMQTTFLQMEKAAKSQEQDQD